MVHYQDPKRQNSANAKLPPKKDLCERTLKNKVQSEIFAYIQFLIEFRSTVISFFYAKGIILLYLCVLMRVCCAHGVLHIGEGACVCVPMEANKEL